jgi:TolB-like protein/Tfp pilus assembly protein PilF
MVAVLPFRDLSSAPDPRLADGVTEEMITTLASIAPEQVGAIARTSAFRYRDTDRDLAEIGRELGVSYVMEGTVQASGDRVRISARLVRIDGRSVIWAESYDIDRRDLLTTERLVAEQVARAVHRRLTPRREPAAPDPAAHERVMEARYLARRGSPEELRRAVALYVDAVQRAPGYAEAHAGLANAYYVLGDHSRARDEARRAIELDPGSADAHHRLAVLHLYDDRDLAAARREFEAAVQANDGLEVVHHSYAAYFSILGQHDRAMDQIARARLIDPVSTTLNADACWYLYVARRYHDAVAQCRHALALDPSHAGAHSYLLSSYLALGDSTRALEHANALAGRTFPDLAAYWRWRLERGGTSDNLALAHLALGDRQRALDYLERAHREKRGWLIPFMNVYPALDPLRDEPRFQALLGVRWQGHRPGTRAATPSPHS